MPLMADPEDLGFKASLDPVLCLVSKRTQTHQIPLLHQNRNNFLTRYFSFIRSLLHRDPVKGHILQSPLPSLIFLEVCLWRKQIACHSSPNIAGYMLCGLYFLCVCSGPLGPRCSVSRGAGGTLPVALLVFHQGVRDTL